MSEQIEQPPLDVVKVEPEEDDETEIIDPDTMTMEGERNEVDSDVEMLKIVADQLSNGPWLSCGSDGGKKLGSKLLDLGEKLAGWKKWEGLCRSKGEELRNVREQHKESEVKLEVMKGNKAELRKTYDMEVERRIKAEGEVAELKKEAGEGMVSPGIKKVGIQTDSSSESNPLMMVLQGSDPQASVPVAGMEVVVAPSSEEFIPEKEESKLRNQNKASDDGDEEDPAETRKAVADASDPTFSLPGTSYNSRRRSGRISGRTARNEYVRLASDNNIDGRIDVEDETKPATPSRPRSKNERRISARNSSVGQRIECRRCKAVLSCQSHFNRHLKQVHAKEERGNFPCYVCKKRFLHKSNFMQHLKTHPKEQSYRCKTCGKSSKNLKNFRVHLKTHDPNRERNFECPTCSFKFFTSTELKNHMVTHRPEKPFKCELCGKGFKRLGDLVEHLRVHTEDRPHSCQICNETFKDSGSLSRHVKIHQGEKGKRHQCPFCNMKFFRKSNCQAHQKKRHKSELASSAQPEISD